MTHKYIGTKEVTAWPADKEGRAGYGVKYADGYTSWSPKVAFEDAYRTCEPGMTQALTFGDALHFLKQGKKVTRAGWNGKGMWLRIYYPGTDKQFSFHEHEPDPYIGDSGTLMPWIGMHTAQNQFIPWLCSQSDALANDWMVI